jgi:hypothetical protein
MTGQLNVLWRYVQVALYVKGTPSCSNTEFIRERLRRAHATETKIQTRKKAAMTVIATMKKTKQRERICPRTLITQVRDYLLRENLVLHCQGPANLSSYCQKQMGIHRLLCTPSHKVTLKDLLPPHIVHPPDLVLPNSTHLPTKLVLYVPFLLYSSHPSPTCSQWSLPPQPRWIQRR